MKLAVDNSKDLFVVVNDGVAETADGGWVAPVLAFGTASAVDPKEKPEIEPEKLPKEDPGMPEEEPNEDDDDDNPLLEPPIGDDPDTEKNKIPIMV